MYHTNPSSAMNRHEGNTLLYQAAGADSQHLTWLLVPLSQCFYGNLSRRRLPVYKKHCRRHREFYCCLCCWCFRRDTLWISANICVGHVRYCFLFNVVYFFVCTLKNSKTKRLPGGVAEPEATGLSTVIDVWHWLREVGQEQNRQTSRKLQVPVICHDLNI